MNPNEVVFTAIVKNGRIVKLPEKRGTFVRYIHFPATNERNEIEDIPCAIVIDGEGNIQFVPKENICWKKDNPT